METNNAYPGMDYLQDYLALKNQVNILYSQSIVTFIFPVLAAICLAIVIWDIATRNILYSWVGVVVAYSLLRYFLLWQYRQVGITPDNAYMWLKRYTIAAFFSGIIWGVAGIILIPYGGSADLVFTIYNGLVLLIICGLVAGAVISYSVNIWVLFSYSFPALVPPAFYLISLGDKFNSAFGGFILLYFFFISVAAYRMNKQINYYMDMEYQQEKLKNKYDKLVIMYSDLRKRTGM